MVVFSALIILLFFSCSGQTNPDIDAIVHRIEKERVQKDAAFKYAPTSPIPDEHKKDFPGLSYFPVDPRYRFHLKISRLEQPPHFMILTSTGMQREAVKYGFFEFAMDGEPCSLSVYKLLDIQGRFPGYLFIPFSDASSGKETYGGGRYLDLKENDSGFYDLDFNLAYNPSCAYGKPGYNCPIPPRENHLAVPVRAGEKNYLLASH